MKISVTDSGSGIAAQFAQAIGAKADGRFIFIPESKGKGFITGFSWGADLRMMIRNYCLNSEIILERTNELSEGQDDLIIQLTGVFPAIPNDSRQMVTERPQVLICKHAVFAIMKMPPDTCFGNITIAVSRKYLQQLFGHVVHPVVAEVLEAKENFVMEMDMSSVIVGVASEMIGSPVPEILEKVFFRLKCEEILCLVFAMLLKINETPIIGVDLRDVKAVYVVKAHLQINLSQPPNIALLAKESKMSEPKLRKLFKKIFGRGVFEYYQFLRMETAANLLKSKKMTVSETGYYLGFTNLSHFSRVFERQHGVKPKKYSNG